MKLLDPIEEKRDDPNDEIADEGEQQIDDSIEENKQQSIDKKSSISDTDYLVSSKYQMVEEEEKFEEE